MSIGFSSTLTTHPSWVIQGDEKSKYENIFESMGPVSGKLHGDKVKPVLLNSKLSLDILGKVWELADIDKDGFLDKDEFCVAMYLVYRAIEKEPVPSLLPLNLIPPSKRNPQAAVPTSSTTDHTDRVLPGAVSVLPPMPSSPAALKMQRHTSTTSSISSVSPKHSISQTTMQSQWVASQSDRVRFGGIFQQHKDPDNLINGVSARNVFVQSGLSQSVLAHVWNLCDLQQIGRLTQDQFILAMHLISQKVKGMELPTKLSPEMLSGSSHDAGYGDSGSLSDASSGVIDPSAMRELDALNQEIEGLRREKEALTTEIQQKDNAIRTTSHEVQELQDTLDKDSSSLAQLEYDKAEAHTRLEELEQQKSKLDTMLADVKSKVQEETEYINSLKAQISAQEATVNQQESEVRRIRNEFSELKKEETQLEQRLEAGKQQQNNADRSVKEVKGEIKKVQEQLQKLQAEEKTVNLNIEQYDKAVTALKSESDADFGFDMSTTASLNTLTENKDLFNNDQKSDFKEDPFKQQDPFSNTSLFPEDDPFGGTDPFSTTSASSVNTIDPFAGTDPFSSSATSYQTASSQIDPFKTLDTAYRDSSEIFEDCKKDPDPFGGEDPFADFSNSTATISKKENETANTLFDSTSFASAFQDDSGSKKDENSLFNDFGAFSSKEGKSSSSDPWGSAFGGGTDAFSGSDPFGGENFGSDSFSSHTSPPFVSNKTNKPPPRPAKPVNSNNGTKKKSNYNQKKVASEADQLAWAEQASKVAEEERLRQQQQEEADLALAIALSKRG